MPITKYLWDGDNILAETDGSDTVTTVYTNEPQQYGNLISQRSGTTTSYFHFDALGSTRRAGRLRDTGQAAIVAAWRFEESARQDVGRSNRVRVGGRASCPSSPACVWRSRTISRS